MLEETAFNRNINRACGVIDRVTFNRLPYMAQLPLNVKLCCCDLVEYYATNAGTAEKSVAGWSQSAGAVSESVTYATKTATDMQSDIDSIISDYLESITDDNGTPLLYLGASQ